MNKHCKGCLKHHNAGHPKGSALAAKYNDWCCWKGSIALKAIGHCKQHNAKQEAAGHEQLQVRIRSGNNGDA